MIVERNGRRCVTGTILKVDRDNDNDKERLILEIPIAEYHKIEKLDYDSCDILNQHKIFEDSSGIIISVPIIKGEANSLRDKVGVMIDKEEKTISISKGLTLKLFMRWWAAGAPKLGTWIGPDSHSMKESVKYIGIDVKQPWTIIALLSYQSQKNVKLILNSKYFYLFRVIYEVVYVTMFQPCSFAILSLGYLLFVSMRAYQQVSFHAQCSVYACNR